ncbi:MAG: right-handed parallel beta-helix repeat-containing protein [Gemmatimonadales bacterium]
MNSSSETRPAPMRWDLRLRGVRGLVRTLSFRDVAVLTAVPVLAVLLLVGDATLRFTRAIQFDDWWAARASVIGMLSERVRAIASLPERMQLRQGFDARAADPAIIRIDVPGANWNAMTGDPLGGWGEWVDATLGYGQTAIDVRLRRRGDNSIHWTTDKRTMTVRTPREEFYKRYRAFALSVKDVVPAYLANRMAAEFGILAPSTELVPLFLNNQFYGMFRFIETVDESMLRPFDRMPGNIFRGDAAERGDYFKGVQRSLFDNPALWNRASINDRWTSAGPGQLALLLQDLRGGTFADHRRLAARFDRDEFARLLAYLLVVGDPYHMDGVHNQFLYEDPSDQTLHPIPWDIRLLDLRRPNGILNDLFQALLTDPSLVDQVLAEVALASDRGVGRVADSLMADIRARHGDFLRYDRLRVGLVPDVGDLDRSAALIRSNLTELASWLRSDTVAYTSTSVGGIRVLDFETRGWAGVDLIGFEPGTAAGLRLHPDRDLDGAFDGSERALALRADSAGRMVLDRPIPLLAAWNTEGPGFRPGTIPFRFFVAGSGELGRPILRNRHTGQAAALIPWATGDVIAPPTGWHPWRFPVPAGRTIRISGAVRLDTTWRLAVGDTLVIEPGTTIRLGRDVSIVTRGPVLALGTGSRPIRVIPADSAPWGTFTLLGPGTSGSVVRNVDFERGGGALVDRIEYIGMVNVHRARGVVFDSVGFIENIRSDDTFHALHSEVTLTNSRFVRANSDAVDFDISTGEIRDNVFVGVGGDAIDLMTSTPRVIGNRITGALDKGISVGEASAPFVFANRVAAGVAGIEIKDRSTPVILNNEVDSVSVGLAIRLKNWRYGGSGFGLMANSMIGNAATMFKPDSAARLTAVAVGGLDSTVTSPVALDWLYAAHGIEILEPRLGVPPRWRAVTPRPALVTLRFADDFLSVSDGWTRGGRTTRLEKRHDVLIAQAEGGMGTLSLPTDWTVQAPGGVVVVEYADRDLRDRRLILETSTGPVSTPLTQTGRLDRFQLAAVSVPAGRITGIRIEIDPQPGLSHIQRSTGLSVVRAGRFDLRSVSVYPSGPAGTDPD